MGKLVEMLWDCEYCGNKGIGGSVRVCPHCGKTRNESTKFYMPSQITYVDNADSINRNEDWLCEYCNSYNSASATECVCCGSPRDTHNGYSKVRHQQTLKQNQNNIAMQNLQNSGFANNMYSTNKKNKNRWIALGIAALLILALIVGLALPKNKAATVMEKRWERAINIEEYKLVEDSSWSLPSDYVALLRTAEEIHHYNTVLDHYETITETKSREVLDGYETYYTYEDLGNGYAEEVEHQRPVYRTEYYEESHQEPIYLEIPEYKTKYYYTIMKWEYGRTEKSSGNDNTPYWPDLNLKEGVERQGEKVEKYYVVLSTKNGKRKEKEYEVGTLELWDRLKVGKGVKVKINGSRILEIID